MTASDGVGGTGLGREQILMFAVVATALLMSILDQTIVATALDSMQRDLGTSVTWVGWTITVYSLGMVMMLSLAGKLTQRIGARRVFLAYAVLTVVVGIPAVRRIPEHRGSW